MRLASLMILVAACGSSSTSTGPDAKVGTPDAPTGATPDAPAGGTPDANPAADGPAGGTQFTLTIDNFDNWCSITQDGQAYSASKKYAKDTVVVLHAAPIGGFIWGYWTGTDGDTTSDHDTNQMTMVTMTGNKDVLACCPAAAHPTCP
jgi:hypothetical protein